MGSSSVGDEASGDSGVKVYWRPGCPYCANLRWRLRRLGVTTTEVNIWKDPAAAAEVRQAAGGNETVPTVAVGGQYLVNPTASAVVELADKAAPSAIDPERAASVGGPVWPAERVAQWVVVCAVIAASFAADATGHVPVSWLLDVVALAAYLAFRLARRSP
ncbi:MAG: glutaredoxin domain-containing protein [Acidimicrobiales bacterium]